MMPKIITFMIGTIIGSFLNVCIHRIPKKQSIVTPGSHCPNCKRAIYWYDNIPLVSFIVLMGRCRFCKTRIPSRYFIVELLTAIVITILFSAFGITPKLLSYAILACGLIVATFVDFEIQEIPDEVSLGGIAAGLILSFAFPSVLDGASRLTGLSNSFIGALAGGASIYLMGFLGELVFKKEAMGGGDVKLLAMIGSFLGWKLVLFTFFVAPIFGSIVGIFLKIKYGREIIPYGPYLSLAALFSIFYGDRLIQFLFYGFH